MMSAEYRVQCFLIRDNEDSRSAFTAFPGFRSRGTRLPPGSRQDLVRGFQSYRAPKLSLSHPIGDSNA